MYKFSNKKMASVLLVMLIMLAIYFRFRSAFFSYPLITHPDEPMLIGTAGKILKNRDLNPHFFNYPSLVIYMQSLLILMYSGFKYFLFGLNPADVPRVEFHVVGRIFASIASVISIYIIYLTGKKFFNYRVGFIAAAIVSVSPIHINNSALVTTDIWVAIFFSVIIFYSQKIIKYNNKKNYVLAGFFVGLAISSKYTAAIFFSSILMAHLVSIKANNKIESGLTNNYFFDKKLALSFCSMVFGFAITTPYSILDTRTFLSHVMFESRHYRNGHLGAEATGWFSWDLYLNTLISNYGLGLLLFLLSLVSIFITIRRRDYLVLPIITSTILFFIFIGSYKVFFDRNIVGIVPGLAIMASYSVNCLIDCFKEKINRHLMWIFVSLLMILSIYPLIAKTSNDIYIKNLPDTRFLSLKWIYDNIPNGSSLLIEPYSPPINNKSKELTIHHSSYRDIFLKKGDINNYNYIVFSSFYYGRFFDEAGMAKNLYLNDAKIYNEFFQLNNLVFELKPDNKTTTGPTLRIYKID